MVKLVRVLMLGQAVLALSLMGRGRKGARLNVSYLVPWFIVGFLALLGLRSLGWIPQPALAAANFFTIVSMAVPSFGLDARVVLHAGGKVTGVIIFSLVGLGLISFTLIKLLGV